jgi:hypothetical protein
MYCPKCRSEYREGFTTCSDCKVELVDELPKEPKEGLKDIAEFEDNNNSCEIESAEQMEELNEQNDSSIEIIEAMHPIKLKSVANQIEAELILNLLRNNNIPCFKKSPGVGGYMNIYMGYSVYGEDIYVDEQDYQKALNLLKDIESDESTIEEDNSHIPFYKNHRIVARIIILVSVFSTILGYIINNWIL